MEETIRMRSCLYGFVAVAIVWAAMLLSAVAAAQEPRPLHWDRASAGALLAYIERIDSHGLKSANYGPTELERAIASDDPRELERQATESFALVAGDLAIGRVRPGRRGRYFIAPNSLDPAEVARLIDSAIASRQIAIALESLAPRNPEYRLLRRALDQLDASKREERRRIEVNLERWRWFPRAPGSQFLLVNIPEFQLRLMQGEQVIESHRVVVGKRSTPTPQFSAQATAVILNPSWHVPQSIIAESVGNLVRTRPGEARRRGYTWAFDKSGKLQVTQQPGPQNALGQLKLEMTNPLSIYIHDTPSKNLFEQDVRAFSHGCIRAQAPFELALMLLAGTALTRPAIDEAVARRVTARAALASPVPVYAVYMTAVPQPDGTVRYLDDLYRLDAAIADQLD